MTPKALHSKASDLWITPPEVFVPLDREFAFVLDACAQDRQASRCPGFISLEQDALGPVPWTARLVGKPCRGRHAVWLNPPFSKTRPFVERARKECVEGGLTVVMFLTAALETDVWQDIILRTAQSVRVPDRRIPCIAGEDVYADIKGVRTLTVRKGERGKSAPKAIAIVVFDPFHHGPPALIPYHVMSPSEWAKSESL